MATAEDKILEHKDKVALSSYLPYDKVLATLRVFIDPNNTTLSAGGTYDGLVTLDNPIGQEALPLAYLNQVYVDFGAPIGVIQTPEIDLIQMPARYGDLVSAQVTVTATEVKVYYAYSSFLNIGYDAYVMLLEK